MESEGVVGGGPGGTALGLYPYAASAAEKADADIMSDCAALASATAAAKADGVVTKESLSDDSRDKRERSTAEYDGGEAAGAGVGFGLYGYGYPCA